MKLEETGNNKTKNDANSQQSALLYAIWSRLESFGAILSHLEPFGDFWSRLEQLGAIWSHLEPFRAV